MTKEEAINIVTKNVAEGGWSSIHTIVESLSTDQLYDFLGDSIGEDEQIEE